MSRFAGRTAVVTGASRGIGLGIAQRLVADGAKVVITARKQEALDLAVAELGGPEHALGIAGAADDAGHQAEVIARAIEAFGSLDLLVNNAGINPAAGGLLDVELGAARKTIEVNCFGAIAWTRQARTAWMGEHGGAVVNISSITGIDPTPVIAMYGATKAMLNYITRELAVEVGPAIRVNAVLPGVVKTSFAALLYDGKEEPVAEPYPLKRLGAPEDVAGAVSFLLSQDASWITGQLLCVDGGLTLVGATV